MFRAWDARPKGSAAKGSAGATRGVQANPKLACIRCSTWNGSCMSVRETPSQHHGTQGVYTPRTDQNPGARSPYKYQREPRNPKEQYIGVITITTITCCTILRSRPLILQPCYTNHHSSKRQGWQTLAALEEALNQPKPKPACQSWRPETRMHNAHKPEALLVS